MKHYTAVQSVTSQAKRLNSSTSPTGQRRVSIAIVPLIMKQEPSWLPTQYIMLVISRPTHTHMSTRALERWTQVVCGMLRKTLRKRRGGGGSLHVCDVTLVTLLCVDQRSRWFRVLSGHTEKLSNSRMPSRTATFKCFSFCQIGAGKTRHAESFEDTSKCVFLPSEKSIRDRIIAQYSEKNSVQKHFALTHSLTSWNAAFLSVNVTNDIYLIMTQ